MVLNLDPELPRLVELVSRGKVVVLSGAGLSTESGIPDYRGPTGVASPRRTPMTIQTFRSGPVARRRYWARSYIGWPLIAQAVPNSGHDAVATLERYGLVLGTVTQNVDGLHQAAGTREVLDLHGRLDRVICLQCGALSSREALRRRLELANPALTPTAKVRNPDGDVGVDESVVQRFVVVDCEDCDGPLKPDVVFFGENVPLSRVRDSYEMLAQASLLLVLGSSLAVFSGRRFALRAAEVGIPIAIVNRGPTRCDDLARSKIDAPLGATLTSLVGCLQGTSTPAA